MSLRQRIPFRFSDNEPEDDHILDEQEQEELIQTLRQQSNAAVTQYLFLVQVVVGLSCALHLVYMLKEEKESPLYALLPHRTPAQPVPLPAFFTVVHIILQLNLILLLLPPSHPILRTLSPLPPPFDLFLALPLPFSHPFTYIAPAVAPVLALLVSRAWPDVAWWSVAGALTWFVYSVRRWAEQSEEEIQELEGMRYNARGA